MREVSSLVSAYDKTVDDLREQMAAIDKIAHTDALTGFLNKKAFKEDSAQFDERLAAGEKIEFALAMLDVNGLKTKNDTYGHEAGDALLKDAVAAIGVAFAGVDARFYRVGGDEFAVLVMDAANELDAMAEVKHEDVSIACGVAHYRPDEDKNIASVLARADALMYKNKRSSR